MIINEVTCLLAILPPLLTNLVSVNVIDSLSPLTLEFSAITSSKFIPSINVKQSDGLSVVDL